MVGPGRPAPVKMPFPAKPSAPPSPPVRPALGALLILAAVALAWSNSLSGPFLFDDHASIIDNPTIRRLLPPDWLRPPATAGETVSGRPVLNLSFALNHAAGGLAVRGYHAVNVLIHALAGLALFGLLRRTLARTEPTAAGATWFALAGALVWALHPLHTAAVTYVVQRAESLAGLFYLLTLYCFVRTTERAGRWWAVACVVACLLGMATKETMATVPLVGLLYDRAFVAGSFRAAWKARWRLYAALAATWLLLAVLMLVNPGRGGSAGLGSIVGPWTYFLTQCWAVPHYLLLAVWPGSLVFDHGMPEAAGLGAVWPQLLLLVALAAGAGWALARNRAAGFLGACFFLLLAPSSSFIPVATQTVAEHRMYLALAVPVLLLGLAGAVAARRAPRTAGVVVAGVALALGLATAARNRVYGSELSLWQDTVAKRPANPRAHNNLGLALAAAGREADAMAEFRRTIELQPNHAFAHFSLGTLLLEDNRWAEAAAHLRAGLAAAPGRADAHHRLGRALDKTGAGAEAEGAFREAIRLDPRAAESRFALGNLLARQRRFAEALDAFHAALAIDPAHFQARANLGNCLLVTGRFREAVAAYEQALQTRPDDAAVRRNLEIARESAR